MNRDERHVFLILDLLQDVNILWPIAQLVSRETDCKIGLLVSTRFLDRDARQLLYPVRGIDRTGSPS